MTLEGAQQVWQVCKEIVGGALDVSSWMQKIHEEFKVLEVKDAGAGDDEEDQKLWKHIRFKNGILTVGCVGFPIVDKSPLMNKKVVSVSRTPGHTKYFQTST